MAKRDKREVAIRRNPKTVRFADLDAVMRACGFEGDEDDAHVVYKHPRFAELATNVPKPHGGEKHVKTVYVRKAIAAIDAAVAREKGA